MSPLETKQMPCTVVIPRSLKLPEVKVDGRMAGLAKIWTAEGEEPKFIVELSQRVTLPNGFFISHIVADVENVEPRSESNGWEGDS
jgi:hypothetical protein